jgi:HEAT repeat protein
MTSLGAPFLAGPVTAREHLGPAPVIRWRAGMRVPSVTGMTDVNLRAEVDELMSRGPPSARAFGLLDRSLLPALSWGAVHHPNPRARWLCLDYLDHMAVQASAAVFIAALSDAVPRVRRHAIHALACQACKDEPWRADVITPLRRVLVDDGNPRVRLEALRALLPRLDASAAQQTLGELAARGDRDLAAVAARQRPRSLPAVLREWAGQAHAS